MHGSLGVLGAEFVGGHVISMALLHLQNAPLDYASVCSHFLTAWLSLGFYKTFLLALLEAVSS